MNEVELIVTVVGILLIAALWYWFFGPKKASQAEIVGNVQEVRITVRGGYTPDIIEARKGIPLRPGGPIIGKVDGGDVVPGRVDVALHRPVQVGEIQSREPAGIRDHVLAEHGQVVHAAQDAAIRGLGDDHR